MRRETGLMGNERGAILAIVIAITAALFLFLSSLAIFGINFFKAYTRSQNAAEYYEVMNSLAVVVRNARDISQLSGGVCGVAQSERGGLFCFPTNSNCVNDNAGQGFGQTYCVELGAAEGSQPTAQYDYKYRYEFSHESQSLDVYPLESAGESWDRVVLRWVPQWGRFLGKALIAIIDATQHQSPSPQKSVAGGAFLPRAQAQGVGGDALFLNTLSVNFNPGAYPSPDIGVTDNLPTRQTATAQYIKIRVCPSWRALITPPNPCAADEDYIHQRFATYDPL